MRANVDKYRRLRREVEDSVTSLRKRYSSAKIRPKIFFFAGKNGMKRVFEDVLLSKEKFMRVASNAESIFRNFPGYLPQYILKRMLKGVRMKGFHHMDAFGIGLVNNPLYKGDDAIAIPDNLFRFQIDLAIYDDSVSYMSHEKMYGIIIHSQQFSIVMKQVFDLAWDYANRHALCRTRKM